MNSRPLLYWLSCICLAFSFSVIGSVENNEWRTPAPENTVYLQTDKGLIIIELAPFMATKHVQRFKDLINEGFYDGLDFYRVIDGFVAQAGDMSEAKKTLYKDPIAAEFTRPLADNSAFISIQTPAFFADSTGYLHGFSAAQSKTDKQEWLLHCPGHVAMARGNEANSASTEFYIVIGQAPRHLDRNMSSLGRVIYGLSHVQALNRASHNNRSGVIDDPEKRSRIISAKMQSQVPKQQWLEVQVLKAQSATMQARLNSARQMDSPFYHHKGSGKLDLCYQQLRTRVVE